MKRKTLKMLAVCVAGIMMFTGCGNTSATQSNKTAENVQTTETAENTEEDATAEAAKMKHRKQHRERKKL